MKLYRQILHPYDITDGTPKTIEGFEGFYNEDLRYEILKTLLKRYPQHANILLLGRDCVRFEIRFIPVDIENIDGMKIIESLTDLKTNQTIC